MKLQLNIELSGQMTKVGEINYTDLNDAVFQYDKNYLIQPYSVPISISLPLRENTFSPKITRIFFEALLPEGFTRKSVAQYLKIAPDNYLDLLEALGQECIGAIQVVRENYQHTDNYQELDLADVKAFFVYTRKISVRLWESVPNKNMNRKMITIYPKCSLCYAAIQPARLKTNYSCLTC